MTCPEGTVSPLAPNLAPPSARADLKLGQSWLGVRGALLLEPAADLMQEPVSDSAPAPGEAPAGSSSETVETWPCSWCRSYCSSAALPLEWPLRPASTPGRALVWLQLPVWSWDWLYTPHPTPS